MIVFEVEVVQTHRWFPLIGWGKRRLPTDRDEWADRDGKVHRTKESVDKILPQNCRWRTGWRIVLEPDITDEDGWEYGLDFPNKYHQKNQKGDFVRRRSFRRVGEVNEGTDPAFPKPFQQCIVEMSVSEPLDAPPELLEELVLAFSKMTENHSLWDKNGMRCNHCHGTYDVFFRRHHCRSCGKSFCWACSTRVAEVDVRLCKACEKAVRSTVAERQRQAQEDHAMLLCEGRMREAKWAEIENVETEAREEIIRLEDHAAKVLRELEWQRTQGIVSTMVNKHQEEHISSNPRQASIQLVAKNPTGLGSSDALLRIVFRENDGTAHASEPIPKNRSATFVHECYFGTTDDTKDCVVVIEEKRFSVFGDFKPIAMGVIKFRGANVTREVNGDSTVEKAGDYNVPCIDPRSGQTIPGVSITVSWVLTARAVQAVSFCDKCGRMSQRCRCV
jgi:hypothetical protein